MTHPSLRGTIACLSTVLATASCGGFGTAAQCEPETIEEVSGVTRGSLVAADASGPTDVWFAGSSRSSGADDLEEKGILVHWDGSSWSRIDAGDKVEFLYDVAVVGPDNVWAFGPLVSGDAIEYWLGHWDGTEWTQISAPSGADVNYSAIDAVAANDVWLVGTDWAPDGESPHPYVAHWDGTSWSRSAVDESAGLLQDVSAFSGESVWAAGYASYDDEYGEESGALVLHWNGESWRRLPTPPDSSLGLDNITALGRDEAWIVPDYYSGEGTTILRWDGGEWNEVLPPFHEVSALSAWDGSAWAAGSDTVGVVVSRFAELSWDRASLVPSDALDSGPFLGLVAVSATTAWGAGPDTVASRACLK